MKTNKLFLALAIIVLVASIMACGSSVVVSTAIPTLAVIQPTYTPYPTQVPPISYPVLVPPTPDATQKAIIASNAQIIMQMTATAEAALLTPTPANTPEIIGEHYAWNYLAMQESGGVNVQIARVLLADKSAVSQDFSNGGLETIFDNRPVVAEIVFIIENKTDKTIKIYTDQGMVVAGGEQIKLFDFAMASAEFGDDFSGDILPGAKVIGGIWIGFKRAKIADIQQMTIAIDAPSGEDYTHLGPDFKFTLDLSSRQYVPCPDELK